MVLNCARNCFYQYANLLPNHLLSIELKYPDFICTTFRFALFHFILFCASWLLSCEFTLSKGKNVEEMLCLQWWQFVSISLHLCLHANRCSSAGFCWRQKCRFFQMLAFLGTLFILAIKILKAKLQTFHSNVLMRES